MSVSTVRVSASPTAVREWAVANDQLAAGQRGRMSAEIYSAYNAKHGLKAVEASFVKTIRVTAKPAKGRSVTRTVNVAQVRAAGIAAGVVNAGSRGRLSKSVLSAFVLGTL